MRVPTWCWCVRLYIQIDLFSHGFHTGCKVCNKRENLLIWWEVVLPRVRIGCSLKDMLESAPSAPEVNSNEVDPLLCFPCDWLNVGDDLSTTNKLVSPGLMYWPVKNGHQFSNSVPPMAGPGPVRALCPGRLYSSFAPLSSSTPRSSSLGEGSVSYLYPRLIDACRMDNSYSNYNGCLFCRRGPQLQPFCGVYGKHIGCYFLPLRRVDHHQSQKSGRLLLLPWEPRLLG